MTPDPYAAIAARLGAQLRRRWTLTGGVSAQVEALELTRDDATSERVVVRQRATTGHEAPEDLATTTAFNLLTALSDAGLPVPRPRLLDVSRALLPTPYLVLNYVEGTTDVAPAALPAALDAMAAFLAQLHALDAAALPLPALPRRDDPVPELLTHLPRLDALAPLRAQLEALERCPAPSPHALLHGDYWPNNILWRDASLAAVIDWEDAALGDPLADLASARVELLWRHDAQAAARFTTHYLRHSGRPLDDPRLALWETCAASAGLTDMGRWGLAPAVEARMRAKSLALLPRAARRAYPLNRGFDRGGP